MRNDKIIGALIGLVGAAGNSGWTEKTDQTIVSALLQEDNRGNTPGEIPAFSRLFHLYGSMREYI